jgi:peptide chain release factor 3
LSPVYFGSALKNFGVAELLDALARNAPSPRDQAAVGRAAQPGDKEVTGFVFKVQANMDPNHRDRVAFLRLASGEFKRNMKLKQSGTGKTIGVHNPILFFASERETVDEAWPGDIIGIPNHGVLRVGDTLSESGQVVFTGIPNFAPEMFRRAVLKDPLKMKALAKGLAQLCEEGATQLFRPVRNNEMILGAVGQLQFEVVAFRLQDEYSVQCAFEPIGVHTARWVTGDERKLAEFRTKAHDNLAVDHSGALVYLAPSRVNLGLTLERWPDLRFSETRESQQ